MGAALAATLALTNPAISEQLGPPEIIASLWVWMILSYVLCGVLAWWRRPASRFGPLMVVAGFAFFMTTLSTTNNDVAYTIGQAFDKIPTVVFLHLFLSFPSGRLTQRLDRAIVIAAYAVAICLELVRMAVGIYGPHNLFEVASYPQVYEAVRSTQLLTLGALSLAGVGVLIARRQNAGRPRRRAPILLVDSFSIGLVMSACLLGALVVVGPDSTAVTQLRWAAFTTLGLAPAVFLWGLMDARLARTDVGGLLVELRADSTQDLQAPLARALHDPSLRLAYWLPDYDSWTDQNGQSLSLPEPGQGSATRVIYRDQQPVAALLFDPSLEDEQELLDAVSAVASIALENGRLHAELRARLHELQGSRARVLEASQRERRRLERDLHDGAQQRLVALSLELGLIGGDPATDPETRARIDKAKREVAESLEELRNVAHGIYPAVLSGHGLSVALESLAARAPVPLELTVQVDGRLPEPIEVAAYFVISETLTNIGKHASATAASVEVIQTPDLLQIDVTDDGVGGADTEAGSGLRGLADRVEALGGQLRIWSAPGNGTRVKATIPCA